VDDNDLTVTEPGGGEPEPGPNGMAPENLATQENAAADESAASEEDPPAQQSAAAQQGVAAQQNAAQQSCGTEAPPVPVSYQRGVIAEWLITIILLLFGTTTLVQAYVIPTGSMENTLLVGDHLLVDKLAYAPDTAVSKYLLPYDALKRGDVIVFRYPVDIKQTFVKRLIGMPGDHIRLSDKQLILNGKPENEPYVYHSTDYIDSYRDNFPNSPNVALPPSALDMLRNHMENGEVVVPPDCYFAMGDNRDNSLDSRYWGFVPRGNIIGKPLVIYWSYDASTAELSSDSIGMRHIADMLLHFPSKTRWDRSFRLIRGYPLN